MPYSIQYDSQHGIILGVLSGEVDGKLLRAYSVDSKKICEQNDCHLILTDYLDASFSFSVVDLYHLPQKHDALLSSVGLNIYTIKRASVFNKDFLEQANFFEDVAVNRGQRFKAFTDKEKALEWLVADKKLE
ncbi:hypothetical protein EG832_05330 [bacterium]|nr:hypothetical protein [bacterium]